MGSILTFLRICSPLDNPDFQTRLLLRPLKHGDPSGAELLRVSASESTKIAASELDGFVGYDVDDLSSTDERGEQS